MIRVSTGWTLFYRIFLPIFYLAFMGSWTIATIRAGDEVSPLFESWIYRISMVGLVLIGAVIIRATVWRLKRLDVTSTHFYLTDYFKTFRYSLDSIASMDTFSIGWFRFLKIELKERGSLGQKFYILLEKDLWNDYLAANAPVQNLISTISETK